MGVDKVINVPITKTVEVQQVQTVEKTVDIPQTQIVEKVVEVPMVENVQGGQSTVNVPSAPSRQVAPVEIVEVSEMGAPLPAEAAPAIIMAAPAPTMVAPASAP